MMYTEQKYIITCRYMFLIGGILGTLFKIPVSVYSPFIMLSLVLIINSQIRSAYLKGKLAAASSICECMLVVYISLNYGGFTYLVLFATMFDVCMLFKTESYTLSVFTAICLAFILYRISPFEWGIIVIIFFAAVFLLLRQLKRELNMRADAEELYDRIRKYAYELEAAKIRLLDYSRQVENIAQIEERNRISGELHDSIGHSLTGILMQVDACKQIIPIDFDKGMELLNSVYQNINESIEVMRRTVKKLKPDEYRKGSSELNELINRFSSNTGINVDFKTSGVYHKLLPSLETVIYSNTQEALTNAARHGHAKNIVVNLVYKQNSVNLIISNDGLTPDTVNKGFGLSGIEERVDLTGGTVSYSYENGFKINMSIPYGEE